MLLEENRLFVLEWSGTYDDFGQVKISYANGYTDIPDDIKLAQFLICGDKRAKRKSGGISEFQQGDLRVKYTTESVEGSVTEMSPMNLLSHYRKVRVCS